MKLLSNQLYSQAAFSELSTEPRAFTFSSTGELLGATGHLVRGEPIPGQAKRPYAQYPLTMPNQRPGAGIDLALMVGVVFNGPVREVDGKKQIKFESVLTETGDQSEITELLVRARDMPTLSTRRERFAGESQAMRAARSLFEEHVLVNTRERLTAEERDLLGGVAVFRTTELDEEGATKVDEGGAIVWEEEDRGTELVGLVYSRTLLQVIGSTARQLQSDYRHASGYARQAYSTEDRNMIHWLPGDNSERLAQLTADTAASIFDRWLPPAQQLQLQLAQQQAEVLPYPATTADSTTEELMPAYVHSSVAA